VDCLGDGRCGESGEISPLGRRLGPLAAFCLCSFPSFLFLSTFEGGSPAPDVLRTAHLRSAEETGCYDCICIRCFWHISLQDDASVFVARIYIKSKSRIRRPQPIAHGTAPPGRHVVQQRHPKVQQVVTDRHPIELSRVALVSMAALAPVGSLFNVIIVRPQYHGSTSYSGTVLAPFLSLTSAIGSESSPP
jgi:hypothetical protein